MIVTPGLILGAGSSAAQIVVSDRRTAWAIVRPPEQVRGVTV